MWEKQYLKQLVDLTHYIGALLRIFEASGVDWPPRDRRAAHDVCLNILSGFHNVFNFGNVPIEDVLWTHASTLTREYVINVN